MLRVPATDRAYASSSSILEPRGGGVGDARVTVIERTAATVKVPQ